MQKIILNQVLSRMHNCLMLPQLQKILALSGKLRLFG